MRVFSVFVILFLAVISSVNAAEISIPLTVHEALRKEVSGINRKAEPVTVGIPFPEGMLYEKKGIPQLSLKGTDAYQFRTLARWPDGSVKWVLVDFQARCEAERMNNDVRIIAGGGNSSGPLLAEEKRGKIYVDTGPLQVQIKKKNYNLFDRVVVNGEALILDGASKGIVVEGDNGTEYLGLLDHNSKVVIEENGPVRAVVKAEGTHTSTDGKRMMDYTVRMHFYKGLTRVKVVYTLRNASEKQKEHPYIRYLDLSNNLNLTGNLRVEVSTHHKNSLKESLEKQEQITYYQAVSDFPQEYAGDSFYYHAPITWLKNSKRRFVQEGYWIKKGGEELLRGKRSEYPDLAFIDISDTNGKGVTIGVRFAAGWWPKSLRADADGTAEVGLWPKENDVGYWIRYGSHNTFEIMYDFHTKPINPSVSMKKFQYPLVAKASVKWYNQNVRGIYPLYHFVSFDEEREFIKKNGWKYGERVKNRMVGMRIWRYHYWGWGGFLNQHDFARIGLVNFLRETEDTVRAGEYFLYAEARFHYNADWAVYHSDDYDLSTMRWRYKPKENREKAELANVVFEWEHPHWYGLPLYYYVTGDERIKDAVMDWAENVKRTHRKLQMNQGRVYGWGMYTLAAMYDFTGDESFIRIADNNFLRLLKGKPGKTLIIDWNRGYIAKRRKYIQPGQRTGYIIFDGLYNYYLNMKGNNPLKEKLADVLEGVSEFMYREPYFEGKKKGHWAFWLPYKYNLEDKSMSRHNYRLILQAFYVNLIPYLTNGGDRWLERMDKIIRMSAWDGNGVWGGFGYMDHPGLQSILYQRLHPREDTSAPPSVYDLSAKVEGRDVILSWTVPAGAVRYQIKYSTKKLVESLEYDPDKKNYKYNPTEFANWWAGENISDEPAPEIQGSKQSFTIKGLGTGHYYFAIKSWDASDNRSQISNLAEVVIK